MPPEAYGPAGALVILGVVVAALWRAHEKSDTDMRIDRDYWRALALQGTDLGSKGTDLATTALAIASRKRLPPDA